MDLATIEMPAMEARKLFLDYRRSVRERHNEEDAQIMRGYREIARGRQLINIRDVFEVGGFTDGFPNLALARADEKFIRCHLTRALGTFAFHYNDEKFATGLGWRHRCRHVTEQCFVFRGIPVPGTHSWMSGAEAVAMVPNIPPALRPTTALSSFHILWEATWERVPQPPHDPALLKHIGGDLWAVLATWNLTALERAVLSGRRA